MQTILDLPGALFHRLKAVAALRNSSKENLIVRAVERTFGNQNSPKARSSL